MDKDFSLEDISIRTELHPGDLGYVTSMHGVLYCREYGFGIQFEPYVARSLCEYYELYDPRRSRAWLCEHQDRMIGSLFLLDRGEAAHRNAAHRNAAQLRFFLIEPEYRGIGLGSKLMGLYMDFMRACGYEASYLWTTGELAAAAVLYRRAGFKLTEERESTAFGKPLIEQRYDLVLPRAALDGQTFNEPRNPLAP